MKKIDRTLTVRFTYATLAIIVIALFIGYALGNFFPVTGKIVQTTGTTTTTTSTRTTSLGPSDIKQWASDISLNTAQFNSCFDSQKYLQEITDDFQEGVDVGITGTPGFLIGNSEKGFVLVVGAQPYSVFKSVIDSFLDGTPSSSTVNLDDPFGDDPVIGNKNAPVIMIEYSDFQCPFCRRFYTEALGQIEQNYVDTGKVVFVYKDFPLDSIHPGATPYALAAQCANEQNKWQEMHNKIFDEQSKLGAGTIPYG